MSETVSRRDARRVLIRGAVQGVGFRPTVYRLALRHEITGWVLNGEAGVEIHAEGPADSLDSFLQELAAHPPPAARISSIDVSRAEERGLADFQIRESIGQIPPTTLVTADLAVCEQCLAEMRDSADRRHHYPYINCTNCGPRYSIIRRLPYDRGNTTMAAWPLCDACRREYDDPGDRRHHAQPTACARCGPGYHLVQDGVVAATGDQAIRAAAEMLAAGQILAVKGIGGYHLACDASQAGTVAELRARKFRKEKPFAVMVRTMQDACEIAELSAAHQRLLADISRPIVIAPAKRRLPHVAPDSSDLGVMLPYAPLHYLLFDDGAPSPLVMTSANRSNEPIAYRDEDALQRLSGIADAFLVGERPIVRRVEDSVTAVRGGKPFVMRRSRGCSPGVVARLPTDQPILAVGADLKNALALVVDGQVLASQHIGDLDHSDTYDAFEETVRDLLQMYGLQPADLIIAHDLHPQMKSTRFAQSLPAKRHVAVQHHEAHVASVLAERGLLDETVVGAALDGTGYGSDGSIWGCEFFQGSVRGGVQRCVSLQPVRMPGGDAAARFPVQAAAGFLADLDELPEMTGAPFHFPRRFWDALELVRKDVRCFRSTSAGRLFDAVAALLGFVGEATFEGQAAVWLESQARQAAPQQPYDLLRLDPRPLLRSIIADRTAGRAAGAVAYAFHAVLARAIAGQLVELSGQHQASKAVLSGGVFQNELLHELIARQLAESHVECLLNREVPANDGGICLGQAAAAWATIPGGVVRTSDRERNKAGRHRDVERS